MGISLYGLTPATTYDALIKTGDNAPIDATLKPLSDGVGTNLPMEASTTGINFTGSLLQGGVAVPTAAQVAAKQDTLVSGTNIKTINGTSVLGSGNIVTPSTPPSGVSGAIQFSNGSAFASDATNFFWDNTNKRLGVGTNVPTGRTQITESYTTTGNNYSAITFDGTLTSRATASDTIYGFRNTQNIVATATGQTIIANDLTPNYTFFDANTNYIGLKVGGNANTQNNGTAIWCLQKTTAGNNGLAINPYNTRWAIGMTSATSNTITGCDLIIGTSGIGIGINGGDPSTRLQVKGSGSTSATTSLLVQNSAGTAVFQIKDDMQVSLPSTATNNTLAIGGQVGTSKNGVGVGYTFGGNVIVRGGLFTNPNTDVCDLYGGTNSVMSWIGNTVLFKAGNNGASFTQPSALVSIDSTTQGLLPPRGTNTQMNAIASPATGLVFYDTTNNKLCVYNATSWIPLH